MPVHAIDHSISRKDGVNHNMLVLLNNFWIGLLEVGAWLHDQAINTKRR
jgi:hypothetical protein